MYGVFLDSTKDIIRTNRCFSSWINDRLFVGIPLEKVIHASLIFDPIHVHENILFEYEELRKKNELEIRPDLFLIPYETFLKLYSHDNE